MWEPQASNTNFFLSFNFFNYLSLRDSSLAEQLLLANTSVASEPKASDSSFIYYISLVLLSILALLRTLPTKGWVPLIAEARDAIAKGSGSYYISRYATH